MHNSSEYVFPTNVLKNSNLVLVTDNRTRSIGLQDFHSITTVKAAAIGIST